MFYYLVCSLFAALVAALPVARDVWTPPITYPTGDTVWWAGETYTVFWNASNPPSEITNRIGQVYLRNNNATQIAPLAQGFPLTDGSVNVTIPANTTTGDDWIIVLFGDSGDWSPPFTIINLGS